MSKIVISIAVYDTEENERTDYTRQTIDSLLDTVDSSNTLVVFVNNNSYDSTKVLLNEAASRVGFNVEHLSDNIGTAEAVNLGWYKYGEPGDFLVKLDNDVTFDEDDWPNKMKACMEAAPEIGILGLKRKDLPNSPTSKEYPTTLRFANHELGDTWHVLEECDDLIGTCHMISPALFEKVGYLYQPRLYGFDDVVMCHRSILAGFKNAFYPSIGINHVDNKTTDYIEWKKRYAGLQWDEVNGIINEYSDGVRPLYYNPF